MDQNPLALSPKIIRYRNEIIDLYGVEGIQTISSWISFVEKRSEKFISNTDTDAANVFKGDMFEVFGELFFDCFSADPAIGLIDYQPIAINDDYGVDAIGTNVLGDRVAVQDKYRFNPLDQIDLGSLAKTYAAGRERHGLYLDKNNTIFLLTTAQGATPPCHEVFGKKLRVINRQAIASKVDNNLSFWQKIEKKLTDTLEWLSNKNTK